MRGTLDAEELASPHPLATMLPGLYQDDDLVARFTSALDTVVAPVNAVLDGSDAYLDPLLAPLDFVAWLAQWVGVELDASWPEARQRALVARAAELYAWRGTAAGLAALVEITTGLVPEIEETGGTAWTATPPPAGDLPGSRAAALLVRLRIPPGAEAVDPARLDRLVAATKPAHIPHRVEVLPVSVTAGAPSAPPRPAGGPSPATWFREVEQPADPGASQGAGLDDQIDGGLDEPWSGPDDPQGEV